MSGFDAVRNLGLKAARRLQAAPKPFVRMMRRQAREQEHRAFRRDGRGDRARRLRGLAEGKAPIILGPWLAEVGYEVLYWIPFLRWFQDAHGIPNDRLIVVSRGGMESAYAGIAGRYVDLFDLTTPSDFAARNHQRRASEEGGGQKQSASSALDDELLAAVQCALGLDRRPRVSSVADVQAVSRGVARQPADGPAVAANAVPATGAVPAAPILPIPSEFIAVKLYSGPALSMSDRTREPLRHLVASAAAMAPVLLLDVDLGIDEHRDLALGDFPA